MSYRLSQLSPQSTHGTSVRIAVQGPWSTPPESLRDMQFWRSWLELDSEVDKAKTPTHIRWNAVLGLVVVVGISASFWTGVGLLVAHIWR